MNKNVQLALLVVVAGVLAFVTIRQRAEIAALKGAIEYAKVAGPAPARQSTPPIPQSEPEPPSPVVMHTPAPPPVSAPSGAAATTNFFSGLTGMMKSPQMKEMVRVQQKVALDRMYGSLLKYLNLPAEQMDTLKQLLLDRQMALADAGMAMMGGSAEERKQATEDAKTINAEYDKKIQDLLGTVNYDVFKQYEATAGERMQIQMFKDALPAEAALTEQQEGDLILAMQEERKAMPVLASLNNQNADPSQLTEERIAEITKLLDQVQQRYAERAATILTLAQLEQFKKYQQQWGSMQVAGLKMAAQMFGNKTAAPPAPSQTPPP